jgi:triphosphoribosyl-dephospho-CoA synthetase
MNESLRQNHILRLRFALASWQDIRGRLADKMAQAQLARRLELAGQIDVAAFQSMATKAETCVEACDESIAALTVDNADPAIFSANLLLAEGAAAEYQKLLDQMEDAESAGRRAFTNRFGK